MCVKLLFDQNISYKVIAHISDIFPNSSHVARVSLESASDFEVWNYAKHNGYVLVSKDSDFNDLATLYGAPPFVIWIRSGNVKVQEIVNVLRKHESTIKKVIQTNKESIIEII